MKLAASLTEKLLKDGIISAENTEIVKYGLENIGSNLLGVTVTVFIGSCFGHFGYGLILWLLLFPLRKNAGGFHAETKAGCLLISAGILTAVFICFVRFSQPAAIHLFTAVFFGGVIFILAPVGNARKHLDQAEKTVYRRRTRIILAGEGALLFLSMGIGWEVPVVTITMNFCVVGISLLAGRLKLCLYGKTAFMNKNARNMQPL